MLRIVPLLGLAIFLAGCGGDNPDTRSTPAESKLAAKASADVEAAMAEARRARALPPPVVAGAADTTAE